MGSAAMGFWLLWQPELLLEWNALGLAFKGGKRKEVVLPPAGAGVQPLPLPFPQPPTSTPTFIHDVLGAYVAQLTPSQRSTSSPTSFLLPCSENEWKYWNTVKNSEYRPSTSLVSTFPDSTNTETPRKLVFSLTCVCVSVCLCEKVCQWISFERIDRFG